MIGCYSSYGPDYLPKRATPRSAGFDIRTPEPFMLGVGDSVCLDTGLVLKSFGDARSLVYYIHLRSSMGVNYGIMLMNSVGVVDKDYEGPNDTLKLFLHRFHEGMRGADYAFFSAGDRIAQIVIHELLLHESESIQPIAFEDLGDNRGGSGSTGK